MLKTFCACSSHSEVKTHFAPNESRANLNPPMPANKSINVRFDKALYFSLEIASIYSPWIISSDILSASLILYASKLVNPKFITMQA